MSLETIKKEMADLLENVHFDCQAAEAHATGANIHNVKALGYVLRDARFSLKNNIMGTANTPVWGEAEFQWMLTYMKQALCQLNLIRVGFDCRTAEREAKKLFNPGKFPGKEE